MSNRITNGYTPQLDVVYGRRLRLVLRLRTATFSLATGASDPVSEALLNTDKNQKAKHAGHNISEERQRFSQSLDQSFSQSFTRCFSLSVEVHADEGHMRPCGCGENFRPLRYQSVDGGKSVRPLGSLDA